MEDKTTIAIKRKYRNKLGMVKKLLEDKKKEKGEDKTFVDMDETVGYLLENLPSDMDSSLNRRT